MASAAEKVVIAFPSVYTPFDNSAMTLIAGIVGRIPEWGVPSDLRRAILQAVSRNREEHLFEIDRASAFLVKVDIGAYDERGTFESPDGSVTAITGDPLLATEGSYADRQAATRCLHIGAGVKLPEILKTARGVFSGAHYDPASQTLSLYTDKLGLRPIYYTITDEYVVFASALRILEAIPHSQSAMDARAATEIVALGFPLGTRTPYAHVRILSAAELLRITPATVEHNLYWSWNTIATADPTKPEELLDRAYAAFVEGIRARIGTDRVTAAYLSGGLDSRCVVAGLRELGVDVHTFTFARLPNEDQYFAAQFAGKVGSHHTQVAVSGEMKVTKWGILMAKAWEAVEYGTPLVAEHPHLVWSGDGGSVGTGFVYLSDTIVERLRRRDIVGSIQAYLGEQRAAVTMRFLSRTAGVAFDDLLEKEVAAELSRVPCDDPGRSFYFFLLLNDQRRHLSQHFEDIDLHRIEYQLPFFDSEFLAIVSSVPLDWGLRHQFYTDWLSRFPATTTAVPWQTYPGHVTCPLEKPQGLAYQWDEDRQASTRSRRRFDTGATGLRLASSRAFPSSLFTRWRLAIAALIHASGFRDYEYVVRAAETYYEYWMKAGRNYSLDAPLTESDSAAVSSSR